MVRFKIILRKIPTGLLSGLMIVIISWLTLAPKPMGEIEMPLFPGADKIAHTLMFGVLCFTVQLELMKHKNWQPLSLATIGVIATLCGCFGIVIEILQHLMGLGRSFEITDILADTAGAISAGGIWAIIQNLLADKSS